MNIRLKKKTKWSNWLTRLPKKKMLLQIGKKAAIKNTKKEMMIFKSHFKEDLIQKIKNRQKMIDKFLP